jgi:PTS system ascorbate-specific IIA component
MNRWRRTTHPPAGGSLAGGGKIGVDLLVAADVVEPRYYQAILDGVAEHGPYFVIAPGWRCRTGGRKRASRKPALRW